MAETASLTMQDLVDRAREAFLDTLDSSHRHLTQFSLINTVREVVRKVEIDYLLELLGQPFETTPGDIIRCVTAGPHTTEAEVLIQLLTARVVHRLVHDDAIQERMGPTRHEINTKNGTINDLPITAL